MRCRGLKGIDNEDLEEAQKIRFERSEEAFGKLENLTNLVSWFVRIIESENCPLVRTIWGLVFGKFLKVFQTSTLRSSSILSVSLSVFL